MHMLCTSQCESPGGQGQTLGILTNPKIKCSNSMPPHSVYCQNQLLIPTISQNHIRNILVRSSFLSLLSELWQPCQNPLGIHTDLCIVAMSLCVIWTKVRDLHPYRNTLRGYSENITRMGVEAWRGGRTQILSFIGGVTQISSIF